jgi:large subunit ribosomal protein L21e
MAKRERPRARGKISFSRYFQKLKEGDFVSVVPEKTLQIGFPKTLQGKTGIVKGKRGKAYVVEIKDKNKLKEFIIKPIHLKKLNNLKK